MTQHCCEDILLQALQIGFIQGIQCPSYFEDSVVSLFAKATSTSIEGCMFQFSENDKVLKLKKTNKKGHFYRNNGCECFICDGLEVTECKHDDFRATRRQFPTDRSFSKWLVRNSFPYIPLFDSLAQDAASTQIPRYQKTSECVEERSLLAPPESLSDL